MTTQQQYTTNATPNITPITNLGATTINIHIHINSDTSIKDILPSLPSEDIVIKVEEINSSNPVIDLTSPNKPLENISSVKNMTKQGLIKGQAINNEMYLYKGLILKCVYNHKGKPTFTCHHGKNITNTHCETCTPEKYTKHRETCRRYREIIKQKTH
jgi:hypothetical protein